MKWSWNIGTLAGIKVRIHVTFFPLLGWIAASQWMLGSSMEAVLIGVIFLLALFGCVVLHEFGHALAARKYGIATRDITLLPIGGLARLERMPAKPHEELWIALAGPAVNVLIAMVLFAWLTLTHDWAPFAA